MHSSMRFFGRLGSISVAVSFFYYNGTAQAQQLSETLSIDQTVLQGNWSGAYVTNSDGENFAINYSLLPISMNASNVASGSNSFQRFGNGYVDVQQQAGNTLNSAAVQLINGGAVVRQGMDNGISPDGFRFITFPLASVNAPIPQNVFSATNSASVGYTNQVGPFESPVVASDANSRIASVSNVNQVASNNLNELNASVAVGLTTSLQLQQTNRTSSSFGLFDTEKIALNTADAAASSVPRGGSSANVEALGQRSVTRTNSASLFGSSNSSALTISGEQSNVSDTTSINGYITKQYVGNSTSAIVVGNINPTLAPGIFVFNSGLGVGDTRVSSVNQVTEVTTNSLSTNLALATDGNKNFQQVYSDRAIETSYAQNNSGGVSGTQNAKNAMVAITGLGNASLSGGAGITVQRATYGSNALASSVNISNANLSQAGVVSTSMLGASSDNIALAHTEGGTANVSNLSQFSNRMLNSVEAGATSASTIRQNGLLNVVSANDLNANSNLGGLATSSGLSSAQITNVRQDMSANVNFVSSTLGGSSVIEQQSSTAPASGFGGVYLTNTIASQAGFAGSSRTVDVAQTLGSTSNTIKSPVMSAQMSQLSSDTTQVLSNFASSIGAGSAASASQSVGNSINGIYAR